MDVILHWVDIIWIPVVFFLIEKRLRWYGIAFVASCMLMLRMQYELLEEFNLHEEGIPNFLMDSDPFHRGLVTYSIVILLYILLSIQSKRTEPIIYMAASITIFFFAFIVSAIIMSL